MLQGVRVSVDHAALLYLKQRSCRNPKANLLEEFLQSLLLKTILKLNFCKKCGAVFTITSCRRNNSLIHLSTSLTIGGVIPFHRDGVL